jgi:hypothetical protein
LTVSCAIVIKQSPIPGLLFLNNAIIDR